MGLYGIRPTKKLNSLSFLLSLGILFFTSINSTGFGYVWKGREQSDNVEDRRGLGGGKCLCTVFAHSILGLFEIYPTKEDCEIQINEGKKKAYYGPEQSCQSLNGSDDVVTVPSYWMWSYSILDGWQCKKRRVGAEQLSVVISDCNIVTPNKVKKEE